MNVLQSIKPLHCIALRPTRRKRRDPTKPIIAYTNLIRLDATRDMQIIWYLQQNKLVRNRRTDKFIYTLAAEQLDKTRKGL